MFVAERFLSGLINSHGKHPVSTDGGTWYPMASRFLGLKHHLHSPYEKSMIERTMQYVKDRTECFDDYFPCRTRKCKLEHVRNWLNLFVDYHNKEIINLKWTEPILKVLHTNIIVTYTLLASSFELFYSNHHRTLISFFWCDFLLLYQGRLFSLLLR